ncbi:uncharacterized protein BX663DRAFT_530219 [Cokeromyces recurvatus]|uniref:uncharacterized protein n=1 Tax=Cokeromyces recurvatus TaxID=90255 RepID=UPI00222096D3|nr:uncharacterized protein BX663DRAFT_530219 [Cokeromyces recurvatus]KAI7904751.1 hypothetical protein BX663DRAFT_530219 [Cokeromyces recurvatus]
MIVSTIIQAAKTEPKQSKLKELARKYGMAGIVVYLAVGCVDLGITFGVIQLAGLDKVRAIEKSVINTFYNVGERIGFEKKVDERPVVVVTDGENNTLLTAAVANEEIDLIKNNNNDTPSFASVFILAYGIHKTLLLPIRLGITAAITPAVVRKLHQMGWARYFPKLLGATKPKNL